MSAVLRPAASRSATPTAKAVQPGRRHPDCVGPSGYPDATTCPAVTWGGFGSSDSSFSCTYSAALLVDSSSSGSSWKTEVESIPISGIDPVISHESRLVPKNSDKLCLNAASRLFRIGYPVVSPYHRIHTRASLSKLAPRGAYATNPRMHSPSQHVYARSGAALPRRDSPGPRAVPPDHPGDISEGLARQRQRGTIEQHGSPWAGGHDCGDRFTCQGLRPATSRHAARDQVVSCTPQAQDESLTIWRGGRGEMTACPE